MILKDVHYLDLQIDPAVKFEPVRYAIECGILTRGLVRAPQRHDNAQGCPIKIQRRKLYPLNEILYVVLCGSICGAESWRDVALFGNEKLDFLKTHF